MLSRHGIRAPKASLNAVCPGYPNWSHYTSNYVEAEALTGKGMLEMHRLGQGVRERYGKEGVGFLPDVYAYRAMLVRSSDSPRCIQSASAFARGVYPDGTGPIGYLESRPAIVPVHTEKEEDDAVLDVRKGYCKKKVKHDSELWAKTDGIRLFREHNEVVSQISKLCLFNLSKLGEYAKSSRTKKEKIEKEAYKQEDIPKPFGNRPDGASSLDYFQAQHNYKGDYPTAIKDIADAFIFDRLEGMPLMDGMTEDIYEKLHNLAFRMFYSRYFDNEEKIVYMSGSLPRLFVENFNNVLSANKKASRLLYSYHTHRDMMYSFAEFFNLRFEGPGVAYVPGVSQGFIPPSASLFFELHSADSEVAEPYIKVFLWLPCNQSSCPFTPIRMGNCGFNCTFSAFANIVAAREKGGDWMKLCKRVSRVTLNRNLRHYEFMSQFSIGLLVIVFFVDAFDQKILKHVTKLLLGIAIIYHAVIIYFEKLSV